MRVGAHQRRDQAHRVRQQTCEVSVVRGVSVGPRVRLRLRVRVRVRVRVRLRLRVRVRVRVRVRAANQRSPCARHSGSRVPG